MAIAPRYIDEVAVVVEFNRVDRGFAALAFEVEDDDVARRERLTSGAFSNVHPDAIDEMVAVGFDDEGLLASRGLIDDQGTERGLSARMEVHFGLLQQEGL